MMKLDIAVIGLAVMGQNLALNLTDHKYNVAVYNRSPEKTRTFIEKNSTNTFLKGFENLDELLQNLEQPRKILLMIKAGEIVDNFIDSIVNSLDQGDIIIDGGNSHYNDTIRRYDYLKKKGIQYLGAGVSGGEEGARFGPSIMVGGEESAWLSVKQMLQDIAARTDTKEICCNLLGNDGAGHFVKMVHNGIEYGDMQLISEIYSLMRSAFEMDPKQISDVFEKWNKGKLSSYLIEITAEIMKHNDNQTGKPLIDVILDDAQQKGTGRWTAQTALELGVSIPLITSAVYQRSISSNLETRKLGSSLYPKSETPPLQFSDELLEKLENSLFVSKLISYNQGFHLLKKASQEYKWDLDLGEIALLWRAGCIIRSVFLGTIKEIYTEENDIEHLIFSKKFIDQVKMGIEDLKDVIKLAVEKGIPVPGLMSSLAYFESIRSNKLSTNLIQAQRDYFGAHTFRRNDEDSGNSYHHQWI